MPRKHSGPSLGKTLIKDRFHRTKARTVGEDVIFQEEPGPGKFDHAASITDQSTLDEFIYNAELAGLSFASERPGASLSSSPQVPHVDKFEQKLRESNADRATFQEFLRIPRRPEWTKDTKPEDLHKLERESFLEWRRNIALFQESHDVVVTPYERNIEMWRQLWRVLEKCQLNIQIVDARNPLLFICQDIIQYVKELDSRKKFLLVINKADFLTATQRQIWGEYFRETGIDYIYYSAAVEIEKQKEDLPAVGLVDNDPTSAAYVSTREEFIETIDIYHRNYFSDASVLMVGLIGYPNVGKSSTINSLMGEKRVSVAATPGKTKHFQTLFLGERICLCDCPGLIFPNFASDRSELVVNGILPIDQLRNHVDPVTLVCARIPKELLEKFYGIRLPLPREGEDPNRAPTASELLSAYSSARGFRTSVLGNPDESRGARHVLKDFVNGLLLFVHPPPTLKNMVDFNSNNNYTHRRLAYLRDKKKGTSSAEELAASATIQKRPTELDEEFFNQDSVQARSMGKGRATTFTRASLYPGDENMGSSKKHFNKDRRK